MTSSHSPDVAALQTQVAELRAQLDLQARRQFDHTMTALARFSGGIAHDFNNVLTIVFGYTDFLLERVHKDGPLFAQLSEIKRAGERAAELTRLLMVFGAHRVYQPVVMNINAVISTCERRLAAALGRDIRLVLHLTQERCLAAIEPYEFEHALLRLVDNAREAMPGGGTVTISTGIRAAAPGQSENVVVIVQDGGPGLAPDALQHVFEPFYSTKQEPRNHGLGLFTVYAIMRQCGGNAACSNAAGGGTVITLTLPRVSASQPAVRMARPAVPPREGATVLLVEDDHRVRALLKEALTLKGFTVLEAEHGLAALRIVEQDPARPDVVLTDVVMPEMNGQELGARLRTVRPELKVIYMSGFTDDEQLRADVIAQQAVFIQKPFTPQQLVQKLRDVLGS